MGETQREDDAAAQVCEAENPLRIYPVRIVDDQVCIDAVAVPAGEVVNRPAS